MLLRSLLFPLLLLLLIGVWSVSGATGERNAAARISKPKSEAKMAEQVSARSESESKVPKALDDPAKDSISDKRGSKSLKPREEDPEEEAAPEEVRKAEPTLRKDENEAGFEKLPLKPARQMDFEASGKEGTGRLVKMNSNQRGLWFGEESPPGIHTNLFNHHHKFSCDDSKCTAKGGTWQPLDDCSGDRDRPMLYCPTADEFCCGQRKYKHRAKRCKQSGGSCHIHPNTCTGEAERKRCRKGRRFCCYTPKPYVDPNCNGANFTLRDGYQKFTASEGRIISPGNMVRYRRNLKVTADLVLPAGTVARFEWKEIEVEENSRCWYDYVEIVDTVTGEGLEPYGIKKFCGRKVPHTMKSKSNLVTIKFITDYSVQKEGFILCFSADSP